MTNRVTELTGELLSTDEDVHIITISTSLIHEGDILLTFQVLSAHHLGNTDPGFVNDDSVFIFRTSRIVQTREPSHQLDQLLLVVT